MVFEVGSVVVAQHLTDEFSNHPNIAAAPSYDDDRVLVTVDCPFEDEWRVRGLLLTFDETARQVAGDGGQATSD